MSADTRPISPSHFAAALKDLSLSTLHLKVLEIRNSIAHLQYSNDQLKPFADGTATATALGKEGQGQGGEANAIAQPDQDCVDAMSENEVVMERMAERIALVRVEVEGRGVSWAEFRSQGEEQQEVEKTRRARQAESPQSNGHGPGAEHPAEGGRLHSAWTDGTFQTGTIRNGEVHTDMDSRSAVSQTSTGPSGGRLSDDELRRAVEERMRDLGNDQDEVGMHL